MPVHFTVCLSACKSTCHNFCLSVVPYVNVRLFIGCFSTTQQAYFIVRCSVDLFESKFDGHVAGLNPRLVRVGSVVDKVTVGLVYPRVLRFSHVSIIPRILRILHVISGI